MLRLLLFPILASPLFSATLTLTSTDLFVFREATPIYYNSSSPEHSSLLFPDNFGSYSWLIPNDTLETWLNLRVVFFLDSEWDLNENGYSNEYGEFLGSALPPGAPSGAIAFSSWEIDEPEYVFGDIYTHASVDGLLDNTNAVPSTSPDDFSLALGWVLGSVAPGQSVRITIQHLTAELNGIAHTDPGSSATLFVNGYAEILGEPEPPVNGVPEPSSILLFLTGFITLAIRKAAR
jgi:hypothetical protein